jgi:hypothetical protein
MPAFFAIDNVQLSQIEIIFGKNTPKHVYNFVSHIFAASALKLGMSNWRA